MSDLEQRIAFRQAVTDPNFESRTQTLIKHMRVAPPRLASWADSLALAGYCGSKEARSLLGDDHHPWLRSVFWEAGGDVKGYWLNIKGVGFMNWVNGLPFWPGIPQRAAIAAAIAVWPKEEARLFSQCFDCHSGGTCDRHIPPLLALLAARAYLNEPTEENKELWRLANVRAGYPFEINWLPPANNVAAMPRSETIKRCAAETSESKILQAICDELVAWSLRGIPTNE